MEFHGYEIEPRMRVRKHNTARVLSYDSDNAYPNRIEVVINASERATSCTNEYAKFIRGEGFVNPALGNLIVNRKRQTLNKILRKVSHDLSRFRGGFSLHFNFDILGRLIEIQHVPYKHNRFALDPKSDELKLTGQIAFYPDWGREFKHYIDPNKIKFVESWNPDPLKIMAQIDAAKGIDNYSGQIMYVTEEEQLYSRAVTDSAIEDVLADCEAKIFRLNNLVTNFLASVILVTHKLTEEERENMSAQIKQFQGARDAGKIFHIEKEHENQQFELKPLEIQKMDGLFKSTEESVRDSIRRVFLMPPVLIGDLVAGRMGTAQEINDATLFYNKMTRDERALISETFGGILQHWHQPVDLSNLAIKELT